MTLRIVAASLILAVAQLASAQTIVRGRVVSDTGVPLRNAVVMQGQTIVRTDADGRFAIDVPQARITVTVSKAGFVRQNIQPVPGELLVTMARSGVLTVVVVDPSGRRVARAAVSVTCPGVSWTNAPTDDRGQRRFAGVGAGQCQVSVIAPDPLPASPLAGPQAAQDLAVTAERLRARTEQQRTEHLRNAVRVDVRVGEEATVTLLTEAASAGATPLVRGNATISGTIRDEFGEPAEEVNVTVQLVSRDPQAPVNLPQLPPALVAVGAGSSTDDRGKFRVSGLVPGTYRVMARWARGNQTPSFYPGRREMSEATVVTVAADTELPNVDFALTPSSRVIAGQILMSDGTRPAGATVQLFAREETNDPRVVSSVNVNPEGQFTVSGLAPGRYDLRVSAAAGYVVVTRHGNQTLAPSVTPSMEFARHEITVADVAPATVAIRTAPGSSLRGRVVFETEQDAAGLSSLGLRPTADPARIATVAADGAFELHNLTGETRMALVGGPPGWWLRSFMIGGVNAADDPVDFSNGRNSRTDVRVMLARAASISGAVTGTTASVRVVAFPVEPDRWYATSRYVQVTTAGRDGRYRLEVPPGQYWLVAVDGGQPLSEALLRRLQSMSTQVFASETRAMQADLPAVRLSQ
jgi:hypothetical protein